ncbi:MAG: ABC transporter permease [Bacillota bacterium]
MAAPQLTRPQGTGNGKSAPAGLLTIYWRRYRRNKMAVAGLAFVLFFLVVALLAPWIAPYHYDAQNLDNSFAPHFSPGHIFGTDDLGRDQLSRIIYGVRTAAVVGLLAQFFSLLIGAAIGAVSGMRGGMVDAALMRTVDMFGSFPAFLLNVILATTFGPSLATIVFALSITGWTGYARLVRGQVLALKNQEYVHAARTLGAGESHIIRHYVLPNILGPVAVALSFGIPWSMMQEAALSLIGVGIRPPAPSWGNLISTGIGKMRGFPHLAIWPTAFFSLTLMAFTFVGDGLQEIFNAKGDRQ